MKPFAHIIIRFRVAVLVLTALVSVAAASLLPGLTADDDVMKFLPQDDPDIKLFNRVNRRFGGLDVAIIGLEADSMLTREKIALVRQMTRKIGEVEGVFDVLSFTEIPDPQPAPDGLRVTPLVMDRIPQRGAELEALKQRILSNENAVGNLISADGRATMILCFLGGDRPTIHIARDIKDAAGSLWKRGGMYFGGSPFIRLHLAGGTQTDLNRLTPIVALVVLLVTFIIFRRPLGVLLALGTVGISILWTMGLIALQGRGLTIVGSSLPTMLMAIGGAYGIHILAGFFNSEARTVNGRIEDTLCNMGPPVLASAATTAAGFLSFLAMDIAPFRHFGLQAAIGVVATAMLAMTAIPAILSFSRRLPGRITEILPSGPLYTLGGFAARNRVPVLAACAILAAVSLAGVTRIAPDATLESFFKEDSEPDRANRFLTRHFGGSTYLQVYFEGDMRSPFVLAQMQKIVEFARGLDAVEHVSAITDSLIVMSEAMGGRADLPETNRRAGSLYPFLEGTAAIDQMISPEKDASLVQIRLADVGPGRVDETVREIRGFIDENVPRGIRVVRVNPYALPDVEASEYAPPAEFDRSGKQVRREKPTKIHEPASMEELKRLRSKMVKDVAGRIVRLMRVHEVPAPADAEQRVVRVLRDRWTETTSPGADLLEAAREVTREHLVRDCAFLSPDDVADDAADEAMVAAAGDEWDHREERVAAALATAGEGFVDESRMRQLLRDALPLSAERDAEGLDITAQSMALSFSQQRNAVRSVRMASAVLEDLSVKRPSLELRERVASAITDLDMPVYGFSDTGSSATTVLARVTGAPVIDVALCTSTISNQINSLAVSIVILLFVMSIAFRSVITAAKGILPALLMLALAVGVMGALEIPIDMTTSMIAAIAIGIGVDYAIHFLWRRRRRGETLAQTTAGVGPSIISNAVQVAAGFAVLCISDMVPMQRFGMLVAMTMVLTAAATFVMLPALRAEGPLVQESEEREVDAGSTGEIRE